MKKRLWQLALWAVKHPLCIIFMVFLLALGSWFGMKQMEKIPALACSPCHVMSAYVEGYQEGDLLARKHQEAGVTCVDCHENGIEDKVQETAWYVTDNFDDPPEKRKFSNEMCTKCHSDMEELVARTDKGNGINPHDSHLGDLTCSDCHKMHAKSKAACQDCHDFEFLKQLPSEWQKVKEIKD